MSTPDFTPRPDEVAGILRRAQRRRLRTAAEAAAGLSLSVLLVAALAGARPEDRASVDLVDGPTQTASEQPGPSTSSSSGPASSAEPGRGPAATPSSRPVGTGDPTPGETAAGSSGRTPYGEPGEDPPPRYDAERSVVARRGATEQSCQTRFVNAEQPTDATGSWCVIIEARTPTGSSSGTSVHPFGGGGMSSTGNATSPGFYDFRFSVCRHADGSDLRLSFAQQREVEVRIRRGAFDGPVVWSYAAGQPPGGRAHAVTVPRSDCVQWQLDWEPYDDAGRPLPPGDYVVEGLSLAPEISELPGTGITFTVGDPA